MTRKTMFEVIGAVLIIAGLIALILFLLLRRDGAIDEVPLPEDQLTEEERARIERVTEVDSRTMTSPSNVIARSFVERYASYSTDVDFANVDDVAALSSPSLQASLGNLTNESLATTPGGYYGVSTRVIAMNTVSETAEAVRYRVTTQRSESIDSPSNTSVRYQDIEIELVKSGDRWLVNSFAWVD